MAATDRWGWCGSCSRWFFVERGVDFGKLCPVCAGEPSALVDEADDAV